MKLLIVLGMVMGVAYGQMAQQTIGDQMGFGQGFGMANPLGASAGAGSVNGAGRSAAGAAPGMFPVQNTGFSNLVYGEGVNSRTALPANRFIVNRMERIARQFGGLVRINRRGDIDVTDRYGQKLKVFGNEIEYENEFGDF